MLGTQSDDRGEEKTIVEIGDHNEQWAVCIRNVESRDVPWITVEPLIAIPLMADPNRGWIPMHKYITKLHKYSQQRETNKRWNKVENV